jgi:hypothetical protein
MEGYQSKKQIFLLVFLLIGTIAVAGCSWSSYQPTKPFPAPIPDNAKYTINFNAQGDFFIADSKGMAVMIKPVPFAALLTKADLKARKWITAFGCYTLYRIKKDNRAWLCDKDFRCVEGRMEGEENNAVFSVNYNGDEIFLGSASGNEVKDLKAIGSLIEKTDPDSQKDVEILGSFTVYKIIGSQKLSLCINNKCYCTCFDPATNSLSACDHGNCN